MDDALSLGAWIRRRRKALDLTQQALAQRVGCSHGAIRKLEADERRPSLGMADRLAHVLEIPAGERGLFLKVARAELAPERLADLPEQRDRTGGSLPPPATAFIGREREVALVRQRLQAADVHLVTLTGPGGMGKTRLALAVAATAQDDFGDGATFVDLGPIRDPSFVLAAIAAALGVTERREEPLLATLQAYLRDKQLLLVLDNFEQVVAAAPLLTDLLQAAPRLRLLVTSRVVLGLYAEHVIAVPPLALPSPTRLPPLAQLTHVEAIRLFVERAVAASAAFVLTEANVHAVVEICRRLDGLPLAIELAAARTRLLPPAVLVLRLDRRLPLLTGGGRDRPTRQQTLRATIDWSYQLLPPPTQCLFWRLAVFVGGWTEQAAFAVCEAEGDLGVELLDRLQSLLDNSLILQSEGPDGAPRFRMLETLREYALEQLAASAEAEAVGWRHVAYYLQMAEAASPHLGTGERTIWLDRLQVEHDNLRAALAWSEAQPEGVETMLRLASALGSYWFDRKHLDEGVSWFERALARPVRPFVDAGHTWSNPHQFRLLRARALYEAAALAHIWCALDQARAYCDECIELYEELGDTAGLADALGRAGLVARDANDDVAALALLERSVALLRAIGEYGALCDHLCALGLTTRGQGDYARSEAAFTEALDLARAARDPERIAGALLELGTLALHQQLPRRAVSALEESVQLFRGQEVSFSLGWALIHLAEARRVARDPLPGAGGAEGDDAALKQCWEEGLRILREFKARQLIGQGLLETGELAYEQGDDACAAQLLRESLATFHELGLVQDIGHTLDAIAALWASSSAPAALRRAVRVWSAATRWHQNKPRLSPIRRARYERTFAVVRTQLGEAAFVVAWAEGQRMPLEQAIAYALEQDT